MRVGAGKNSHLRANQARSLVTDMFQGGGDVDLLHSCGQRARGCSGCPEEDRTQKVGPSWGGRLGGLDKAWG